VTNADDEFNSDDSKYVTTRTVLKS